MGEYLQRRTADVVGSLLDRQRPASEMTRLRALLPAALLVGAPGAAANPLGLPGPDIFFLPFFAFAPIALICLALAFSKPRRDDNTRPFGIGMFIVIGYTLLFGVTYLLGITAWQDGAAALAAVILIAVFAVACVYFFSEQTGSRVVLTAAAVGTCTLTIALTPSIVSFRYYTFVDNNPLPDANDNLIALGFGLFEIENGRVLELDMKGIGNLEPVSAAAVKPISVDRYEVSISVPSRGFVGREISQYRRDMNALFHVRREEIVREKYQRFDFAAATWVGEQREKDVKLFFAAGDEDCSVPEISSLLDSGANPNALIGHGFNPSAIFNAVSQRCVNVVDALIAAGADLTVVNQHSQTPLLSAARQAEVHLPELSTIVERLIAAGADIGAVDADGNTALHLAAIRSVAATRAVLDGGADIDALNRAGQSALQRAEEYFGRYGRKDEGQKVVDLLRSEYERD